jgi:uncharacterized membrane protein
LPQNSDKIKMIIKIISVFLLGALELVAAIPSGFAMGLSPMINILVSSAGGITGVIVVALAGEKLVSLIYRIRKTDPEKIKSGKIYRVFNRYGLIGLALAAPLSTGFPLGAALSVSLGTKPKRIILWLSLGIILWTILMVFLGSLGVSFLK